MLSGILKQPPMVLLMFALALLVLPVVAWLDYQQGMYLSTGVSVVAACILVTLGVMVQRIGFDRSRRLTLLIMFGLVALGSMEKLGSPTNFAWFTVMPFLYISVGGVRFGGSLALGHYGFIAFGYWFLADTLNGRMEDWIQFSLAYATAGGLAYSYDHVQRDLRARLQTLAEEDALTGLLNRRGMERRLQELADFLTRHNVVVTLAILDVDHFKKVNDEYGHDVGDQVLQELSAELRRVFRSSDYLARWGGEEFLVALTRTQLNEAMPVLDRMRAAVADAEALSVPSLSISTGAAEWRPGMELSLALKQADRALYEAKNGGRNKVIAADDVHGFAATRKALPGLA